MDNLPTEILLIIISKLNHKSKLSFSETSKKYRQIIQSNYDKNYVVNIDFTRLTWSRFLKHKYDKSTKDFNVLLKCKRKFNNFHVQGLNEATIANNRFLQVFKRFSANIKSLCLEKNCELALVDLVRILKLTPKIEELRFIHFKEIGQQNFELIFLPKLDKLKTLSLEFCRFSSYSFFSNYQFEKLSLAELGNDLSYFLTSQYYLKDLTLECPWIFFNDFSSQVKFKLTKLVIFCETLKDWVNVCKFIKTQENLKDLQLPNTIVSNSKVKDEILEFIFGLKLNHLTISIKNYDYRSTILSKQNTSLTSLNLTVETYQEDDYLSEKLLGILPNLESLHLRTLTVDNSLIDLIGENLRNLNQLHLLNCPAKGMRELKCQNLKKVTFEQCEMFSLGDWEQFSENNQNIKSIFLNICYECLTDEIVDLLTRKLPNLEYFEVDACYNKYLTMKAEDTLFRNCKYIKSVKLFKKKHKAIFEFKPLKLVVYQKRIMWKHAMLISTLFLLIIYVVFNFSVSIIK